jgi:hypothetical protein
MTPRARGRAGARRLATLLLAVVAVVPAPAARGQDRPTPPPFAAGDLAYDTALVAAKANPAEANLRELRLAYTRTRTYAPNPAGYADQGPVLAEAVKAEDWPAVLRLAQAALERNYVRMRPHFYAALALRHLGQRERAAHHRAFFNGLHRSIVEGSDGATPATAYQVITIEEEYDVLAVRRLKREGHTMTRHEGRPIDVITARGADGASITLYFDVSLPWGR